MFIPSKIIIKKTDLKSVVFLLWLNISLVLATMRFVLARIGNVDGTVREVMLFGIACIPLIYIFVGLSCFKQKSPDWMRSFFKLFSLILLVFVLSFSLNPRLEEYYFRSDYGIKTVFRPDGAIFAFLFFSMFEDPCKLRRLLTKSAYVKFFYLFVVVFIPAMLRGYWIDIAPGGSIKEFSYSLSFGYDMLFPLTVFLTAGMDTHKTIHYVFALVCAILIITNGGRGAIVVFFLFVALLALVRLLLNNEISRTKKTFLILGIALIGITSLLIEDTLFSMLIDILIKSNINSRSIQMFIDGTFSDSNGRVLIWSTIINAIREGGLFGYGMFGDRPFVAPIHVAGYSHNLFLELLVSFGIAGLFLIVYIITDAITMIFFCKDKDWQMIYIILFTCSCKLMLSLSIWYVWEFWAAAAVAYKYRKLVRKKKNEQLSGKCSSERIGSC